MIEALIYSCDPILQKVLKSLGGEGSDIIPVLKIRFGPPTADQNVFGPPKRSLVQALWSSQNFFGPPVFNEIFNSFVSHRFVRYFFVLPVVCFLST